MSTPSLIRRNRVALVVLCVPALAGAIADISSFVYEKIDTEYREPVPTKKP